MNKQKQIKLGLKKTIFGLFFAILGILGGITGPLLMNSEVWAVPNEETSETNTENAATDTTNAENTGAETTEEAKKESENACYDSLGAIGWLVCPTTGKLAELVDALYAKIQEFLTVSPVLMEDGQPVYEIWKYCLRVANVMFIIFLLIIIYSQITGLGISNYGIKRALPKLVVMAVMVNLSFLICSLLVDVSNIVGSGLADFLKSIGESAASSMTVNAEISKLGVNAGIIGGGTIATAIAAIVAVETGAIWMVIPVVLGAVLSVVVGFFTLALRQALVIVLVMVSPLAIVACVLPNTEVWYRKWKQLFSSMLFFYPMFAVLFGASNLAGLAIMMSANSVFGILLGTAVQIFPLVLAVKLMKMSGTVLGGISGWAQGLVNRPLAGNRAWADSRRELSRQKHLATQSAWWQPSRKLNQFLEDRKNSRAIDTEDYRRRVKTRGLAYNTASHYKRKDGSPNRKGELKYALQADNMNDQGNIDKHLNNMNAGFGVLAVGEKQKKRLDDLDIRNVNASDYMFAQKSRGAQIEFENAKGRYERFMDANYAHLDEMNEGNNKHQRHNLSDRTAALERYNNLKNVMGDDAKVYFTMADASQGFAAQSAVTQKKFSTFHDLTPATQDVYNNVIEMAKKENSREYVDELVGGMRILNKRGDTDLVRKAFRTVIQDEDGKGKIELGTYASQALMNFAMFDVKDADPLIRRFGKYGNIETAHVFNDNEEGKRRKNKMITFDEYINGEYDEVDDDGNVIGVGKPNRKVEDILQGTSFKGMERTALANMTESIRDASMKVDANGNKVVDIPKFMKNQQKIWDAILPNIISDQFAFLSGSEQINAMAKFVTGMKGDEVDWKGIFGEEAAAALTDAEKNDYVAFLDKRTSSFMGGQVANQIARTKSDILGPVLAFFKKMSRDEDPNYGDRLRQAEPGQTDEYYDEKTKAHYDKMADEKLANSINQEVLDSVAIMYHKGYQGDTKANLAQHLKLNDRYSEAKARRDGRRSSSETDDDEDGFVAGDSGDAGNAGAGSVNRAQNLNILEQIFRTYNHSANDQSVIRGFWDEVLASGILSGADPVRVSIIDSVVQAAGYTNTADLRNDIEDLINET